MVSYVIFYSSGVVKIKHISNLIRSKHKKVIQLGWFQFFHRELHNIDEFATYLQHRFNEMNAKLKFETYVQQLWVKNEYDAMIHAQIIDVDNNKNKWA